MGIYRDSDYYSTDGKRDDFTMGDLNACAKSAMMKRGRAAAIVEEVRAAVAQWPAYATQAKVAAKRVAQIKRNLRLEIPH